MYVYILYSEKLEKFYVGQTQNVQQRIQQHNTGLESSTRPGMPWRLIWYTLAVDRGAAMKLEKKIKNLNSQRKVAFMIKYKHDIASTDELQWLLQLSV